MNGQAIVFSWRSINAAVFKMFGKGNLRLLRNTGIISPQKKKKKFWSKNNT